MIDALLGAFGLTFRRNTRNRPSWKAAIRCKYTLPVGMLCWPGRLWFGNDPQMLAAALLGLIPILSVFLFAERYFVQ